MSFRPTAARYRSSRRARNSVSPKAVVTPRILSFPGPQAYRQAYERGVKILGVTAHFVTMHLDEGPIIAQGSFAVRSTMGMKEIITRGQQLEAKVLVKAVKLFLTKRLDVYWGVVREV